MRQRGLCHSAPPRNVLRHNALVCCAAGTAATFELFALVGVVAVTVMWATVPETRNKSLEDIEAMWVSMDGGEERRQED